MRYLESAAGHAFLTAMQRRIGESAEQRLRWVVDFTKKDLTALRREERIALGYDLRIIAVLGLPLTGGYGGLRTSGQPMADEVLQRHQAGLAAGLRHLLSQAGTPWEVPSRPALIVHPNPDGSTRVRLMFTGDEAAGVFGGVANLLLEAGDRLRACRKCRQPFVKRKRQEYCSGRCSMRVRDRTRWAKRRKR